MTINKSVTQDPVIIFQGITLSQFKEMLVEAAKTALLESERDPYAKYPKRLSRKQVAEILEGHYSYSTIQLLVDRGEIKRYFDKNNKGYFKKDEIVSYKNSL